MRGGVGGAQRRQRLQGRRTVLRSGHRHRVEHGPGRGMRPGMQDGGFYQPVAELMSWIVRRHNRFRTILWSL